MPNIPIPAAVTGLPTRRLFLAGTTAVAVAGAPLVVDPVAALIEEFDAALAVYQAALAAEYEASDRFEALKPTPPPWRWLRNVGWHEIVTINGKKRCVLDCSLHSLEKVKEQLATMQAHQADPDTFICDTMIGRAQADIRTIEAYQAECDRLKIQCGVPASLQATDDAADVLDPLADKIMADEPTSLLHLAAQARCVMHGLRDPGEGSFPELVIAFCEKQSRRHVA